MSIAQKKIEEIKKSKGVNLARNIMQRAASNSEKTMNVIVNGGLAYLGVTQLANLKLPDGETLFPWWLRFLWGPIALKLATTPVNSEGFELGILGVSFPVNAQVAGLGMLAALGFASLPWEAIGDEIRKPIVQTKRSTKAYADTQTNYPLVMTPEEKSELERLQIKVFTMMLGTPQDLYNANVELQTYIDEMTPIWEARLEELKIGGPSEGSAR